MSINRLLLETMLDLHKTGRSAIIRVGRELTKKQLVLRSGRLSFAESNLPQDHLARIMITGDLLPRNKVNEIASLMKTGKTSEEAILEISGQDKESLKKGRLEQALYIMASILDWGKCELRIFSAENLVHHQIILDLPLPEFLVLSARRAASAHLVAHPPGFKFAKIAATGAFGDKANDLPLDRYESFVYGLAGQGMAAADVLSVIPAGSAPPEELLLRLYSLGLIKFESPLETKPAEPETLDPGSLLEQLEEMLLRYKDSSLYEILSIKTDAGPEEVQAAYHGLARQYHPDRFQSTEYSAAAKAKAEELFTFINEAYTTLRNPANRAAYDEKRLTSESKVEATLKARASAGSEEGHMAEVLYREGRLSLAKGEFQKAVEQLKGCVYLNPEKATYNYFLGVAESEIPQLQKSAEQHLLKALELDAVSVTIRLELAKLYLKVRLSRKAELHLREVLQLDPENKEARGLQARLEKSEKKQMGFFSR
jgi:curved DNA-binding protein CbpA